MKTSIQYAIKTEELTVQVYSHMYDGVSKKDAKDMLAVIIEEKRDMQHIFQNYLRKWWTD
ncbi:hypothetical protein ACYUJ6_02290 [Clostridium sp. JNZ X4-2]